MHEGERRAVWVSGGAEVGVPSESEAAWRVCIHA